MTCDRELVVQNFRHHLESSSFVLGQVNDELESWLFRPGVDRVRLLQWCLDQLNPSLRDQLQSCDENIRESRVVKYVKALGVSRDDNTILGSADETSQILLWKRLILLLEAKRKKLMNQTDLKSQDIAIQKTIASTCRSKDFLGLMHLNVNLVPLSMRLVTPFQRGRDLEKELQSLLQELEKLQSSEMFTEDEESILDQSVCESDNFKAEFLDHYKKIQECYQHIAKTVFPCVLTAHDNPVSNVLGELIENVADNVIAFVQMMRDTESIYMKAKGFETDHEIPHCSEPSHLQQCVKKCHSLIAEILSLWKIHNLL